MERLIERDEFGNADIIALSDMMPEIYAGLSFSETNALTDVLNRLAAYEDTGLEPEEIKELCTDDVADIAKLFRRMIADGSLDHLQKLLQSEKDGRLVMLPEANDPLTLDELREMDGEPVWVVEEEHPHYALITGVCSESLWLICREDEAEMLFEEYGKTWLAYRREPEHSKEA